MLVRVETSTPGRYARNRRPMASRRIPLVLEDDFPGQKPIGRRQTSKEVRDLIFQMMAQNRNWGAPRIHGELLMLGFDVSERTISRWMKTSLHGSTPIQALVRFSAVTIG